MGGLPADARPFDDPILLPGGRELVTLRDAAAKSSFASPRAATRNASSGNGRCRPSPHPMARASIRVFLLAGQDHRQRRAVASLTAGSANEPCFEIRKPDVIRPLLGADPDRMAAMIVRAIDQETAHAPAARRSNQSSGGRRGPASIARKQRPLRAVACRFRIRRSRPRSASIRDAT